MNSAVIAVSLLSIINLGQGIQPVNSVIQQQTTSSSQERDAQIWEDKIVYTNFGGSQDIDIWQKDLNGNPEPLISKPGQQWAGDLHGDLLAYTDYQDSSGQYQVWLYNLKTQEDKQITFNNNNGSPILTDKYLYYIDGYACGSLIQYSLEKETYKLIDNNACIPNASDIFVTWYSAGDVYAYDINRNLKITVAEGSPQQEQPAIYQSNVVWYETENGNNKIILKNLYTNKVQTVVESTNDKYSWPSISKDFIVWGKSTTPGIAGVEGFVIKTGQVFELQPQGSHQNSNLDTDIYDNTAVWQAWRTGNGDIYSASIIR